MVKLFLKRERKQRGEQRPRVEGLYKCDKNFDFEKILCVCLTTETFRGLASVGPAALRKPVACIPGGKEKKKRVSCIT